MKALLFILTLSSNVFAITSTKPQCGPRQEQYQVVSATIETVEKLENGHCILKLRDIDGDAPTNCSLDLEYFAEGVYSEYCNYAKEDTISGYFSNNLKLSNLPVFE